MASLATPKLPASQQTVRLLHIEDCEADALLVRCELVESMPRAEYVRAKSLGEGLKLLGREEFDLALVDLNLPDHKGVDTFRMVRQAAPNLPLVVLTGSYDEELARGILRRGAQDYLVKGRLGQNTLGHIIHFAIERQRYAAELDHKREQLAASEARLRQVVEANGDAMVVVDGDGKVHFVNPAACVMFGRSREELLANPFGFPVVNGHPSELDIIRRDGTTGIAEMRVVETAWNEQPVFLASLRDITKRKAVESSLSLFRALVDHSNDTFEVIDPVTGQFLDVSEKGLMDLGYSREELLKLRVADIAPSIDHGTWNEIIDKTRQEDGVIVQGTHQRKDGSLFPVEVNAKIVHLDREYLVAVVRDISDRLHAEDMLRRDAEILSCLPDAIVFTDLDGKILYWNEAATKLLGWTAREMVGQSCYHRLPEADYADTHNRLTMLRKGQAYERAREMTRKDGTKVWVQVRAFPFNDGAGKPAGLLGILHDDSERRQLENQLRQTQKMEAIGTLAGGIAHDLNNIVMAINGYTELARMACTDPDTCGNLDMVLKAAERANVLVSQILTFSRQQPAERQTIQLYDIVQESLSLLRATLPSTIEISTDLSPTAPSVLANAGQIQQVLLNLGANALHAMDDQLGRLEVRLESITVDELMAAQNPQLQPGDYVRISVTDNGHGMDEATVRRIFEPFYTTKPVGKGTGLGLAAVHGIMHNHEGAITVYSQPGIGTTFRLYFPVYAAGAIATEQKKEQSVPQGDGQRILFVDDEAPLVQLGQTVLKMLNYKVETATNGTEALEMFRSNPEHYDLIITDQTMPGMTGMDFAKHALVLNPQQRVILTSGFSPNLTPELARAAGIRAILPKPNTVSTLANLVHRVLHED